MFMTQHGRYHFCHGPVGFAAMGYEVCCRIDKALGDIENCVKVIDDILSWDSGYEVYLRHVHDVLLRCREYEITLNVENNL